jgi:hypothetical protein
VLGDPTPTESPPPPRARGRAIATTAAAAAGAALFAFVIGGGRSEPALHAPPVVRAARPAPVAHGALAPAWDACLAPEQPPPSPLDAIALASAAREPARDPALAGVSIDGDVIATWTERRVWLSVDGGARWGRVLDGPGRIAAVHADACGRVVVVRAQAGAPLALGTRTAAHELWRALPHDAGGAFLGLAVRGPEVAVAARAIASPGRDLDDEPAAIATSSDRGARWSAPIALGDVAAATPVLGRDGLVAVIAPRACPIAAPCSEVQAFAATASIDRRPYPVTVVDDPAFARAALLAPPSACGGAIACFAWSGDALEPVELAGDPPPIARFVATRHAVFAVPADPARDLYQLRGGEARPVIGSAGFPVAAADGDGALWGVRGAALVRLGVATGVATMFEVPGAPPPAPAAAAGSGQGACPAPTAIRPAAPHDQLWLVPLATLANDRLAIASERDLDVGAESAAPRVTDPSGAAASAAPGERVRVLDAARARAAGAPPLPHDAWILGRAGAPACHGVVRGYYASSDDSPSSVVGAMVDGCGADSAGFAALDADPGACSVASLGAATPADLPADLAAQADGAYPAGDPRADGAPTYTAAIVRVPDDGRGFARLTVDSDDGAWSSGWRWLPAEGASVPRPEVKDGALESITAVLYDADGPKEAVIAAGCKVTIATIGDRGALARRAIRSTCPPP